MYEWGPLSRLPPPGVLSENEGDGELGGRVMELIKLGPLSILQQVEVGRTERQVNHYHVKKEQRVIPVTE